MVDLHRQPAALFVDSSGQLHQGRDHLIPVRSQHAAMSAAIPPHVSMAGNDEAHSSSSQLAIHGGQGRSRDARVVTPQLCGGRAYNAIGELQAAQTAGLEKRGSGEGAHRTAS